MTQEEMQELIILQAQQIVYLDSKVPLEMGETEAKLQRELHELEEKFESQRATWAEVNTRLNSELQELRKKFADTTYQSSLHKHPDTIIAEQNKRIDDLSRVAGEMRRLKKEAEDKEARAEIKFERMEAQYNGLKDTITKAMGPWEGNWVQCCVDQLQRRRMMSKWAINEEMQRLWQLRMTGTVTWDQYTELVLEYFGITLG